MKTALVSACLLLLAFAANGQPAPGPGAQMFLIHEEIARPSMLAQYESTTRDLLGAFTEKNADPKIFGMNLFVTTDMHYIYVVPIANWAALDTFQQSWMAISQAVGKDRWKDLMTRGNAAMSSYNEFVVMRRPDLSYVPATPRLKAGEVRFIHWQFHYLDAARADEAEQIAKDYAALFRAKNISDPFTVFMAMSGNDLPLLVVAIPAKSPSDYYSNADQVNAALGADVRPLVARAMAITRKYETRDGTARPELSYPLPAAK